MTPDPRKLFHRWLKKNRDRLPAPIERFRARNKSDFYRIVGSPHLQIMVARGHGYVPIVVSAHYRGQCIDLIFDCDIAVIGNRRLGFECDYCDEESRTRYATYRELLENHGFEVLLEWLQQNLRPENLLVMVSNDGMSWAKIVRPEEQHRIQEYSERQHPLFVVVPIVAG